MKEIVRYPRNTESFNRLYNHRYIKDGYDFIGWNTKKDGTGYWYPDGCAIYTSNDDNKTEVNEPLNLYAQWRKKDSSENVTYKRINGNYFINGYNSTSYITQKLDKTNQELTISAIIRPSIKSTKQGGYLPNTVIWINSASDSIQVFTDKITNNAGTLMSYNSAHGDTLHFVFRQTEKFTLIQMDNLTTGEKNTVKIDPIVFTSIQYSFRLVVDRWQLFQGNKLMFDLVPVELVQVTSSVVDSASYDIGSVGFINLVDGSFITDGTINLKQIIGKCLHFYKPSDVDSCTITFEPVGDKSKGLKIKDNTVHAFTLTGNVTQTSENLTFSWTLDSTNPSLYLYIEKDDTNRLAVDDTCYMHFTTSAPVNVTGHISALVGENLETCDCTYSYQFYRLLAGTKIRTAPNVNIGKMTDHCLNECFADNEELIEPAPMIETESIERSACAGMYQNCPKLRTTSLMNKTKTLGEYSLVDMYGNDTTLEETANLTTVEKIGFGACQGMHAENIALYRKQLNLSETVTVEGDSWSEYMLDNTAYEKRQNLKDRGFKDYEKKIINSWNNSIS